jgi:DNA-binding NtrC family response regulator
MKSRGIHRGGVLWQESNMSGRVLVVDDEQAISQLVAKSLTSRGYTCDQANGVPSAQEKLRACQYDVLLTDKNMPFEGKGTEGGLELIRWARLQQPDLSIIVMTGFATIDSAVEALKLGAFDYLMKPLDLRIVLQKVDRLCEYRKFVNPAAVLNLYLDLNRHILEAGNPQAEDLEARLGRIHDLLDHLFFMFRSTERTLLEHRQRLAEIAAYAEQSCDDLPPDHPARNILRHVAEEAAHRL